MKFFDDYTFDFDLIMNKVNENVNWFYQYLSEPVLLMLMKVIGL